jgi:hypothetical protein
MSSSEFGPIRRHAPAWLEPQPVEDPPRRATTATAPAREDLQKSGCGPTEPGYIDRVKRKPPPRPTCDERRHSTGRRGGPGMRWSHTWTPLTSAPTGTAPLSPILRFARSGPQRPKSCAPKGPTGQ